jgi:hypothetical protein
MRTRLFGVHTLAGSLPVLLLAALLVTAKSAAGGPTECNISKVNKSCQVTIDRHQPVAPPSIQMYSDQQLTVVVKNPYKFERYFLDYATGVAAVAPDVTANLEPGLATPLAKLAISVSRLGVFRTPGTTPDQCKVLPMPPRGQLSSSVDRFSDCLATFVRDARTKVYSQLEPYAAPDSISPSPVPTRKLYAIGEDARQLVKVEAAISTRITTLASDDQFKPKPGSDGTDGKPKKEPVPADPKDVIASLELGELQKAADAVGTDLLGFEQRIAELLQRRCPEQDGDHMDACDLDEKADAKPIVLGSMRDSSEIYNGMASRTITYSLDALNLVTNSQDTVPDVTKKRAIASIAIVFADDAHTSGWGSALSVFRWEASAGLFFSSLPVRTYRVTDDFGGTKWRSDLYWTFAVGVNPNTVTADFATGPSISWRAAMVSLLAHWGHETRLTQGFTDNESLGASFSGSTVPTESHWTTSIALGISVRVPALTGR